MAKTLGKCGHEIVGVLQIGSDVGNDEFWQSETIDCPDCETKKKE